MALQSRQRTPNPHLGSYYGIVASAFVSLTILLAMAVDLLLVGAERLLTPWARAGRR